MLHALLHGKLDPATLEPERREDALTSTVFGTLVLLEAWDVLALWLGVDTASEGELDCWFWPRLGSVEPDVVLRIGSSLIVVEAKYRSGRHDLKVHAEDERPSNQLVRQHACFTHPAELPVRYPDEIDRAINECTVIQVYMVDGRRISSAIRECDESRLQLPAEARLEVVTWQRLYRLLGVPECSQKRWAIDLRRYLKALHLDTFEGFGKGLSREVDIRPVFDWRAPSLRAGLSSAACGVDRHAVQPLLSWHPSHRSAGHYAGFLERFGESDWVPVLHHWRKHLLSSEED